MIVLVPAFLCLGFLLSYCPVSVRTAECDPLGYDAIAARINSTLSGVEGKPNKVVSISYNCFAHGIDPRKLRSFIVTVDTRQEPANSTYRFICDSNGLYTGPDGPLSQTRPAAENISFDSHCVDCAVAHPVCQPCNSSCVNNRCFGPDSAECCNYLKNNTCVVDCGTNFAPNDSNVCECANKLTGPDCSVCSLSCQNGGTENPTCSHCMCLAGYTGDLCETEINGCDSNPCMNQGTCTRTSDGGFSCNCLIGYTGDHCETEISGCDSNPCMNQGTCTRTSDGGFSCNCLIGYTGDLCETEINGCDSNPCMNQGTCTRTSDGGFSCNCLIGYTGNLCETEINGCDSNPCMNQGTCTRTNDGGFSCGTCLPESTDFTCQCDSGCFGFPGDSLLVCVDCNVKCVHGSVKDDCSACVCGVNWNGDSCSECNDIIEDDRCVKNCTNKDYQPTEDPEGKQWCFACAIFLCEECNRKSVKDASEYQCSRCKRGARIKDGRCTTGPDTKDDTSDSNNIGLIIGLILGILALCAVIGIVAYYMYKKRASTQTSGYYKTSSKAI